MPKKIEKAWRNSSDSCTTYCCVGFVQKKIIAYYVWYFNANGLTCELQNSKSFDLQKGNIIRLGNIVIKIIRVWYSKFITKWSQENTRHECIFLIPTLHILRNISDLISLIEINLIKMSLAVAAKVISICCMCCVCA